MKREKLNHYLKVFILAIMAGVSISIGAISYLISQSVFLGAICFCVGLFIIVNYKFNLFTGKLCYISSNKPSYLLDLLIIYIGNFVGTNLMALLFRQTRLINLVDKTTNLVNIKLNDTYLSLFILAILCNLLIYIAVEGFKSKHNLTRYLSLFFGVSIFVICGFEHCVADMFYFAFASTYTMRMFMSLLVITIGNIIGGNIIELIKKFIPIESNN